MLDRKSIHSIKEVEGLIKDRILSAEKKEKKESFLLDGDPIYTFSDRYKAFIISDYNCTCCGIKGVYFAKEKNFDMERYHLNLYALDENKNEVLMTKKKIPNTKDNIYVALCDRCQKKINKGEITIC